MQRIKGSILQQLKSKIKNSCSFKLILKVIDSLSLISSNLIVPDVLPKGKNERYFNPFLYTHRIKSHQRFTRLNGILTTANKSRFQKSVVTTNLS